MIHVPSQCLSVALQFNYVSTIRQDVRYFAYWTRRRSLRECSQTEQGDDRYVTSLQPDEMTIGTWHFATGRDDDRYATFLKLPETTTGSIPSNDRTSFQIISMKLKCSVKCDANNLFADRFLQRNCVITCVRVCSSWFWKLWSSVMSSILTTCKILRKRNEQLLQKTLLWVVTRWKKGVGKTQGRFKMIGRRFWIWNCKNLLHNTTCRCLC